MILLRNKYLKIRHIIHSRMLVLFNQINMFIVFNLSDNCLILNTYNNNNFNKDIIDNYSNII